MSPESATLISRFQYPTYDKVGNRKSLQVDRGTGQPVVTKYNYNNIYELIDVTGGQTHTFTHDNVGNRLDHNGTAYQPNNINQYTTVGTQAYLYDNNGNLTNDGTNTYTYDEENRLSLYTSTKM